MINMTKRNRTVMTNCSNRPVAGSGGTPPDESGKQETGQAADRLEETAHRAVATTPWPENGRRGT